MCMVYVLGMLRVNVYLPDEINQELNFLASSKGIKKAQLIRNALKAGLDIVSPRSSTASNLLGLAEEAEKIKTKGIIPRDLIENLDYYTWGGTKKNDK